MLEKEYRLPINIRVDNEPEFISHRLNNWCNEKQVHLAFIQPGKPAQNAHIEGSAQDSSGKLSLMPAGWMTWNNCD